MPTRRSSPSYRFSRESKEKLDRFRDAGRNESMENRLIKSMNRNKQVSLQKFARDSGNSGHDHGVETKGRTRFRIETRVRLAGRGRSANERGLIKLVCSAICAEIKSRWTSVRLRPTPAHPRNITNGYRARYQEPVMLRGTLHEAVAHHY